MSLNVCHHVPNGLGARDEWGRMVCARCGRPYDEPPVMARPVTGSGPRPIPVVDADRFNRMRQSYEMKVADFARETLRASSARALAARLWHILEVEATSAAEHMIRHHDFCPPDEMEIWDGIRTEELRTGGEETDG